MSDPQNTRVRALTHLIVESMLRQAEASPAGKQLMSMPLALGTFSADVAAQLALVFDQMIDDAHRPTEDASTWQCVECGEEVAVWSRKHTCQPR